MLSIYYFDKNLLHLEFWSLMTSSLKKMIVLGKSFIAFFWYVVHKNRTETLPKNKTQLTAAMAGREAKKRTQMGTNGPCYAAFLKSWQPSPLFWRIAVCSEEKTARSEEAPNFSVSRFHGTQCLCDHPCGKHNWVLSLPFHSLNFLRFKLAALFW